MKGSWQPSEIEIVNIVDLGIVGVQEPLPDRRVKGNRVRAYQLLKVQKIQKKARKINISIIERDRYIISNIGTKTPTELAQKLNVSQIVIYDTCKNYGVEISPVWKYSETEMTQQKSKIVDMSIEERNKYILTNIDTKTLDELAEELKVSVDALHDICTREVSIELYRRKKARWKNTLLVTD